MPRQLNPPLATTTRELTLRLRQSSTDAEHRLWQVLRAHRLGGHKFRRQHSFPPYVVDFVCLQAKLIVELDGSQHTEIADAPRTRFLEALGFQVIRFWDNEALLETDAVAEAIFNTLENRTLSPTPPPEGEGL